MSNLGGKPLAYSSGDENRNQQYFLAGFFGFLFVLFLGIGIFLGVQSGKWWVMYFIGPIALLIGVLAVGFFPRGEKSFYRMTVYDGYLVQEWKNEGDPEVYERRILFEEVSDCLIGIVSRKVSGPGEKVLYRYHALLVLDYGEGQFRQEILSAKELYEWRRRLFDKVGVLRYAKVDLLGVLESGGDFSGVPWSEENMISNLIGLENERPFTLEGVK